MLHISISSVDSDPGVLLIARYGLYVISDFFIQKPRCMLATYYSTRYDMISVRNVPCDAKMLRLSRSCSDSFAPFRFESFQAQYRVVANLGLEQHNRHAVI